LSRRGKPPSPPEPETPEAAPETPAQAERRKRGLLGWVLIALIALSVLGIVLLGAGRLAVLTPAGRELVLGFIEGKEIGRYGRINVEGLSGDLWDDFTLDRVTITDRDGVWLEAENVRVDWSYLPLITRRFHADSIEAEVIRLVRRPIPEPDITPPGRQPLTIDIDRLDARVEFQEGFSEEYGRWTLAGDMRLDRGGRKEAAINAFSVSRPGDYLRVRFNTGSDGALLGSTIVARAHEAQGGPIAGAFGYSPDQPFDLNVNIREDAFDALVRTGDYTPVEARGRFSDEGGQGGGYIRFAGSDLLAPFAERLGPQVRFGIGMRPVEGQRGQFGLGWRVRADNLAVEATGVVTDSGDTVGEGVRLNVSTPSVTRLAGQEIGGGASLQGVWNGGRNRWTFSGDAALERASLAGYGLQRVSGPIDIEARGAVYNFEADLSGTGGSGSGLLASLIGPHPRALIRGTRLADSRLLIRRFDLDGAALDITAQGVRGLNRALSAEGAAVVTDVSRLRRQARGALALDFSASQRGAAPWSLRFTADGRGLRTGWSELDRLLGPSPRLVGAGLIGDGRIAISRADLSGAAGRMSAQGLVGLGGGDVRLALDWNARGPFGVGPVEIGGAATGDGALTGTLARPVLDLTADFAVVEAGPLTLNNTHLVLSFRQGDDASDGRVTVTGDSAYGPARAFSLFRIADDGVQLTDMDINAGGVVARGDLALRGSSPSSADLTFEARPGAFLAAGTASGTVRLTEGSGDALALVDVTGRGVRFAGSSYVIRTLRLQGQGTLARLPFTLQTDVGGSIPASFDGSGVYSRTGEAQTVTLEGGGEVREVAYQTRGPAIVALAGDGRVVRVDLAVGGGVLEGELRQDSEAATIVATLTGVDLRTLSPDLLGRVTADVNLRGTGDNLEGTVTARLQDARSRDADANMDIDALIQARLQGDRMLVEAEASDAGGVQSSARLDLPVTASAAPLRLVVNRTEPMSGEITLQGQIRSIWDLVLGGERSLSGMVDGRATLAGSINAPRADGYLNITDGRFEDGGTGVVLSDLVMRTRFDAETARILTFEANDGAGEGGGRVTGQGSLGLQTGSASNFTLMLSNFRVIQTDLATARASGPISVQRDADGAISLSGQLNVSEAEISADDLPNTGDVVELDVIEINRPGGLEDEIEETAEERAARRSRSAFNLDVHLNSSGGNVFVVGRGLDVELALDAHVTGSLSDPILSGDARVVRGDYQFGGRRFAFERGGTITLSTEAESIRLNLTAMREDPTLTARIRVTGTAARPIITLTSEPQLPQDEILSQVLFGRSASQLSPVEAAQLASSIAALAGGGGFDVVGNLREFAGLDRLSFGGDASGLTIAGGKYIGDDLYFEVIGGGEAGAAVQVEWRARRNVSVVSRIEGDGDARLYIRWRRTSRDEEAARVEQDD
jgi:translocation and assembly module TamB